MTWLSYALGVVTLPVLFVLFSFYLRWCSEGGRLEGSRLVYCEHEVTGTAFGKHQHEYSTLIPPFVREWRIKRDFKNCVYSKLGKTAGGVLADEVRLLASKAGIEIDGDADDIDYSPEWLAAERLVAEKYGIADMEGLWALHASTKPIDQIARAQLARLRVST